MYITTTLTTKELEQMLNTLFEIDYSYMKEEDAVSVPVRTIDMRDFDYVDTDELEAFCFENKRHNKIKLALGMLIMNGRIHRGLVTLENSHFFPDKPVA
jgi:hypothetical protein